MTRRTALQILAAVPCAALAPPALAPVDAEAAAAPAPPPAIRPLCVLRKPRKRNIVGMWHGFDPRTGRPTGGDIFSDADPEADRSALRVLENLARKYA